MAVPKKKRSAQIVASRRSNSISKLLQKYYIIRKTSSQAIIGPKNYKDLFNSNYCNFYVNNCGYNRNSTTNNVCSACYSVHFRKGYKEFIHK